MEYPHHRRRDDVTKGANGVTKHACTYPSTPDFHYFCITSIIEMNWRSVLLPVFEITAHILGWLLAVLALNSLLVLRAEEVAVINGVEQIVVHTRSLLPYILVSLAVKAVWVYGCALWIFPAYFKKKKMVAGLALVLSLVVAAVLIEYGGYAWANANDGVPGISPVQTINYRPAENHSELIPIQESQFSFWNLSLYVLSFTLSIAWFFARDWNKQEKQLRELQQLQTGTELKLLKLQINPHFLFNTLNNLFSVAQKNRDEETAEGIAKLAELMRYQLHESQKTLLPLEQEIDYIRSYIELARMRCPPEELEVVFNLNGEIKNRQIPPMLLIPFVENAFKHGLRVGRFSRIAFSLHIMEKRLVFSGSNPDHAAVNRNDTRHAGIGLENVRRRLALLYPQNNELTYGAQNSIFQFNLNIPI